MGAPSPKKAAKKAPLQRPGGVALGARVEKLEADVERLKQTLAAILAAQAAQQAVPNLAQELQGKILAELNGEGGVPVSA